MRIMCVEDEEQRPQHAKEGQGLPSLLAKHVIELNNSQKSSDSHYNGEPGVAKPDGNEEDGYEE